jgi:hypothetical protein
MASTGECGGGKGGARPLNRDLRSESDEAGLATPPFPLRSAPHLMRLRPRSSRRSPDVARSRLLARPYRHRGHRERERRTITAVTSLRGRRMVVRSPSSPVVRCGWRMPMGAEMSVSSRRTAEIRRGPPTRAALSSRSDTGTAASGGDPSRCRLWMRQAALSASSRTETLCSTILRGAETRRLHDHQGSR